MILDSVVLEISELSKWYQGQPGIHGSAYWPPGQYTQYTQLYSRDQLV